MRPPRDALQQVPVPSLEDRVDVSIKQLEGRRLGYSGAVLYMANQARQAVRGLVEGEETPFNRPLRESPVLQEMFIDVIVHGVIGATAGKFKSILRGEPTWNDANQSLYQLIKETVPAVVHRAWNKGDIVRSNSEDARILHQLYEQEGRMRHHEEFTQQKKAIFRPMKVADIPRVREELYNPYLLTSDTVARLLAGEIVNSWRTFLMPFEDHEQGVFADRLQYTEWADKQKSVYTRHKEEMLKAMLMINPQDGALLGVSAFTIGPYAPTADSPYGREQAMLADHGISGGVTKHITMTRDAMYDMYMSSRHFKLFLIIGKVVGAAMQILAANVAQMRPGDLLARLQRGGMKIDLGPGNHRPAFGKNASVSTYYAGGGRIEHRTEQGIYEIISKAAIAIWQNIGSEGFLKKFNLRGPFASDENSSETASRRKFLLPQAADEEALEVFVRAFWFHVNTEYPYLLEALRKYF